MYPIVKQFHLWLVLISITIFQFRYWFFKVRQQPPGRLWRVLPHVTDTLLLTTGVWLAWWLALNPLEVHWLGVKLLLLVLYIVLGTVAMKKTAAWQWFGYLLATLVVLTMVWVASHKQVWPA